MTFFSAVVSAGGGKSIIGCYWQIKQRLKYAGTRGLIGRAKAKTLKETTLNTFWDVCKMQGLRMGIHLTYNSQTGLIKFFNGSEILLKDLFAYPSDPEFDELGSLEITDAFIDEANQITSKARQIVRSRIRYKLDENNLVPKILYTCNPAKNWTYSDFFKPSREGTLSNDRVFIQSLVTDNPFISETYVENLKQLDKNSKERLLYGNWDYDDDPTSLCTFDKIQDIFTNDHVIEGSEIYISADLAMQGRDRFVAGHWKGLVGHIDIDMPKATGKVIELTLKMLKIEKACPNSHIVADADGLGNYLDSYIENIVAFHGNKRAFDQQYSNIKSECGFKLAELINKGLVKVVCSSDQEEALKTELSACLKRENIDADDQKKRLISKDKMKSDLQRSPDYFDWMLLRMYFELYNTDISVKTDYL